jgi:glycosyltransferase involved in cell wall biosynthesis
MIDNLVGQYNAEGKPLVSVCVPVYNGADHLRETLVNIISQSYADIEIVIVDDCSVDGSREIVEEFAKNDNRIRFYINQTNVGLVGNWNECIKKSTGEWIKFCFQDDLMLPKCVESLLGRALELNHSDRIVFCREAFLFDDEVRPAIQQSYRNRLLFWNMEPGSREITPFRLLKLVLQHPGVNFLGEPTSFLIERGVFDRHGCFDPIFHHMCDLEYWLRAGLNSENPIAYINESLVEFRVHNNSTSMKNITVNCFNSCYVDRLMLHHKMASHADYAALRSKFDFWPCSGLFRTLYAISCRRARIAARYNCNEFVKDDWQTLCNTHPEITYLSKKSWLDLSFRYVLSRSCALVRIATGQIKGAI